MHRHEAILSVLLGHRKSKGNVFKVKFIYWEKVFCAQIIYLKFFHDSAYFWTIAFFVSPRVIMRFFPLWSWQAFNYLKSEMAMLESNVLQTD